jgi:hypothetical protein
LSRDCQHRIAIARAGSTPHERYRRHSDQSSVVSTAPMRTPSPCAKPCFYPDAARARDAPTPRDMARPCPNGSNSPMYPPTAAMARQAANGSIPIGAPRGSRFSSIRFMQDRVNPQRKPQTCRSRSRINLRLWSSTRWPARLQGAAWPLKNFDLRCRVALQFRYRSSAVGWTDERRKLPCLCGTNPRPDAETWRHRHHGQRQRSQGRRCARGHRSAWRGFALPSTVQSRSQPNREILFQTQGRLTQSGSTIPGEPMGRNRFLSRFPAPECAAYLASAGYGQPNRKML